MTLPLTVSPAPFAGGYGSPFGAPQTITLAANATHVLPYGTWIISTGAHDTVTFTYASATTITVLAASSVGTVISDGTNVEVLADATGGTSTVLIPVLGI